jgi:chloride channel protein, CIC family
MFAYLTYLRRRLETSQGTGLLLVASVLGVLIAVSVWLYRLAIEFFHELVGVEAVHAVAGVLGPFAIVAVLALTGYAVGWWMERFVGLERHHGVAGVIEAVTLAGGRLPYKKIPFKAFASAVSLGAGASIGPEDPSVQIGSNAASWVGRLLNLREESLRMLVAAGAAAGVAAAFKAPIAGVFFALEVILNNSFSAGSLSAVIMSAVVASAATQALEPGAEMGPFNYQLGGPFELPLFLPLGLFLGLSAVVFVRSLYRSHDLWHTYVRLAPRYRTAIAGGLVGLLGVFLPQILGVGRETMNSVLNGSANYGFALLVVLFGAKIVATITSLSGGFIGGVFAPSLFAGTMLGSAYGQVVDRVFGLQVGDPQAYAIAGMAGMLAGVLRAPITSIMMVFELTNDYRLILPIMLTTIVCVVVADRFEKHSIYSFGLARSGLLLQPGREIDMMQGVTVGEAMLTPAPVVRHDATLVSLRDTLRTMHTNSVAVLDADGQLCGVVTLADLQRAYERPDHDELTVGDICSRDLAVTHPEDDLWTAIRIMSARDVGRLPVVRRGTREIIGFIGRHGVVRAYNIATARKLQDQHMAEQVRLGHLTGGHVVNLPVMERSPVAETAIRDVKWPADSVVASITRNGRLLVPHGSTVLHAGDLITVVADPKVESELRTLTTPPPPQVRPFRKR